jgi:hypothetical protein
MLQLEAYLPSACFKEMIVLSYLKISFAALILLAGVVAVSAAPREVIQNEKGTFIQEQSGAWHQYNRVRREVAPPPVVAQAPLDHAKGSIY